MIFTVSNKKINYLYNASSVKVEKKVNGTNIKTTHYTSTRLSTSLDGFQYVNDDLSFFPHAEGYVHINGNPTKTKYWYDYVYNYTDHLGNFRLSYTQDRSTGGLKVLEEHHYYPFGLDQDSPRFAKRDEKYKYKYNGKELQEELGLEWYDYGVRNYNASLGRWMNADPLAETTMLPYSAFNNSPIRFNEPTGMIAEGAMWPPEREGNIDEHGNPEVWTDSDGSWVWDKNLKGWSEIIAEDGSTSNIYYTDLGGDDGWGWLERPSSPTGSDLGIMTDLTTDWLTGSGDDHRYFINDGFTENLKDAPIAIQAKSFCYNEVNAGRKKVTYGVSNFRGKRSKIQSFFGSNSNFGPEGYYYVGLDPVEQFIGGFRVDIHKTGKSLIYIINNNSSSKSLLYGGFGQDIDWERSTMRAEGTMRQTYIFSEPIKYKK